MKPFRVWLLVLLTVLLPLRGALAAAMTCPGAGVQTEGGMAQQAHDHGHAHAHAHGASGDHAVAEPTSPAGGHHAFASVGDHAAQCNLCSAFCSVTGMVSDRATTAAPQKVATVFPHLYAPPPSFIPDGQERPPRTI